MMKFIHHNHVVVVRCHSFPKTFRHKGLNGHKQVFSLADLGATYTKFAKSSVLQNLTIGHQTLLQYFFPMRNKQQSCRLRAAQPAKSAIIKS